MVFGVSFPIPHRVLARRVVEADITVPFKVAFEGQSRFPIVQVSLPGDGNPVSAAKLGKALAPLR